MTFQFTMHSCFGQLNIRMHAYTYINIAGQFKVAETRDVYVILVSFKNYILKALPLELYVMEKIEHAVIAVWWLLCGDFRVVIVVLRHATLVHGTGTNFTTLLANSISLYQFYNKEQFLPVNNYNYL